MKLYVMNEDRQWEDKGTGYVSSSYVELLQGMALLVRSEEDGTKCFDRLFFTTQLELCLTALMLTNYMEWMFKY